MGEFLEDAMQKVLKWVGIGLAGMTGLVVIAVVAVVAYGQVTFKRTYRNRPLYPITADTSPEGVARGEYLVRNVLACADCHSTDAPDGALSGQFENISEGPISGVFAVPNLTPDPETGLGNWTDAEIARAIREGIDKDGVGLLVMPSFNYHVMSDQDVAAMIGYLRSLNPVVNPIPTFQANTAGKVVNALGMMGASSVGKPITAPQVRPERGTAEYNYYITTLAGCRDCHGMDYAGGRVPFSDPSVPPAPI